jgi:hypothetical protein
MARTLPNWLTRFRKRPVDPFTRASRDGLDLVMAPPYDMSEAIRSELRAEVEALVGRLLPKAVDAYSGEVLDSWLDARADQIVARLQAEREERQAVCEALVGLARQEVARRQSRFESDLARVQEAQEALEVARKELTGKRELGPFADSPVADHPPVTSTVGRVDTRPRRVQVPPQRSEDTSRLPGDADFVVVGTQPNEGNGNGHATGK